MAELSTTLTRGELTALALIGIDPPVLTGIDPVRIGSVQAGRRNNGGWADQGWRSS
jgi:hypothetical protein